MPPVNQSVPEPTGPNAATLAWLFYAEARLATQENGEPTFDEIARWEGDGGK